MKKLIKKFLIEYRKVLTQAILNFTDNGFVEVGETGLSKPRIVCAAVRGFDGRIVVIGARHYDIWMNRQLKHIPYEDWNGSDFTHSCRKVQGFIDQHGNFYGRQDAWVIAKENDQIIRLVHGSEGTLYSENLY